MNLQLVIEAVHRLSKVPGGTPSGQWARAPGFWPRHGCGGSISWTSVPSRLLLFPDRNPSANSLLAQQAFHCAGLLRYAISRGYVATAPLPTVIPKEPPQFVPLHLLPR